MDLSQCLKRISLLTILLWAATAEGQHIADGLFTWYENDSGSRGVCFILQKSAEISPALIDVDSAAFWSLGGELVSNLDLSATANGTLKIYLRFEPAFPVYVERIGVLNIQLGEDQRNSIVTSLSRLGEASPGLHRGQTAICEGIIYLDIARGKARDIRNLKFDLAQGAAE